MKKLIPNRLPRKLVLRREAIAQLNLTQLGQVAGASVLGNCSQRSNVDAMCVPTIAD